MALENLYPNASLGQFGRTFQIGAGTIAPDVGKVFIAIQALTDAVVTLSDAASLQLIAGTVILGRDATATVVSGNIVAYQGV